MFLLSQSVCLIRLEKLAGDKHFSLLRKFANYGQKKFIKYGQKLMEITDESVTDNQLMNGAFFSGAPYLAN